MFTCTFFLEQVVACGLLCEEEAAAVLACEVEAISELVALFEALDMDASHPDCSAGCRKLTASLRTAHKPTRPTRFSAAELELLARLRATHCSLEVGSCLRTPPRADPPHDARQCWYHR